MRELLELSESPKVREFIEHLDAPKEVQVEKGPGRFDVREIFPDAATPLIVPCFENATNEDFERILHWLESTDSAFRFIVMNTWARVGGPLHRDSECLLQLAWEDDGSRDSRGACRLLGTRPSQPVIELGEYYLKQGNLDLATLLLMRAWRPEYTSVFQKQTRWTIPKTADELDAYHDLACQSVELMKEAKHLSLVPLAEWAIQFNPCCVCREHSIQFLSEHGLLSPELASESKFDAVKFE